MTNDNRFRNQISTVLATLAVLAGLWIFNFCGSSASCSTSGLPWMWHMAHKKEFGMIGQRLEPGREYYFEIRSVVFHSNYPQFAPVSAQEIEVASALGIATIRIDQKYDTSIYFEKTREPFTGSIDVKKLGIVVNGDYYFSLKNSDELGEQITIDQAIRSLAYVKVAIYLQKIKQAEVVRRGRENRNWYTYWSTTGYAKEFTGFNMEDGNREDFRQCFAESDGSHAACPDALERR